MVDWRCGSRLDVMTARVWGVVRIGFLLGNFHRQKCHVFLEGVLDCGGRDCGNADDDERRTANGDVDVDAWL
jgi:hypothetical protein